VVEAISLAYELAGQPSPLAVRDHSTRSMAASVASWSSPHTFVRFYHIDFSSTPGCCKVSWSV